MLVRLAAASAVVLLGVAACGGEDADSASATKGKITVGAFDFPEGRVLAAVYAAALDDAGYDASVTQLSQREVVEPALQKGDIDVVPEYVSSALNFYRSGAAGPDDAKNLATLKTAAGAKGVTFYTPAPATDNYAYVVSKDFATKNGIATVSDLAAYSKTNGVTMGGTNECRDRDYCKGGLERVYGMKVAAYKVVVLSSQDSVDRLTKNECQVVVFNSSDGVLSVNPVTVLKDDKGLNPNDNIVPAVNTKTSTPDLQKTLDAVSAKLTPAALSTMNKDVQIDRKAVDKVAEDFVDGL